MLAAEPGRDEFAIAIKENIWFAVDARPDFAEAWRDPPPFKWFRIVATDGPRRRAWTNPIWADALD